MTFQELWNKIPEKDKEDCDEFRYVKMFITDDDWCEIQENENETYDATVWKNKDQYDIASYNDFQSAIARVTEEITKFKLRAEQSLKYLED